jgi:hypothetical protein
MRPDVRCWCGTVIEQTHRGRTKIHCSARCRTTKPCPHCGARCDRRAKSCRGCNPLSIYDEATAYCGACYRTLPLTAFYARTDSRYRRVARAHCKECEKREVQRRRKADPGKQAARSAVAIALRAGTLRRKACRKCGASNHVQAHHTDYNQPLKVRWLCPSCHAKAHLSQVASRLAEQPL